MMNYCRFYLLVQYFQNCYFLLKAVIQRISKSNKFIDNAKLRAYLRSVAGIGATEQESRYAEKRLKELSGPTLQPTPKLPYVKFHHFLYFSGRV